MLLYLLYSCNFCLFRLTKLTWQLLLDIYGDRDQQWFKQRYILLQYVVNAGAIQEFYSIMIIAVITDERFDEVLCCYF